MAEIRKKKKHRKHFSLIRFAVLLFVFSGILYLGSSLFLRSYNNTLSTKKQSIDSQIATIQTQNDAVQVEIQTLSSSDRVDQIAANNGMSRNQSNVTTIKGSTADGE